MGLNILDKRQDGYHNIETIFFPLNLFDTLTFEPSDHLSLVSNNKQLIQEENNSILKAIQLLENKVSKKFNVKIYLEKNIPIGAGMGGGSSDGGATLSAINKLFQLNLIKTELEELALQIGSDAPYFINPVPSFAQSRGEQLKEIKLKIPYPILIINPGVHLSTKWAYNNFIPETHRKSLSGLIVNDRIDFEMLINNAANDFEKVVFPKFPEISDIKKHLYDLGAMFALMTGSGSTVFGIFHDLPAAENAKEFFPDNYFRVIHTP